MYLPLCITCLSFTGYFLLRRLREKLEENTKSRFTNSPISPSFECTITAELRQLITNQTDSYHTLLSTKSDHCITIVEIFSCEVRGGMHNVTASSPNSAHLRLLTMELRVSAPPQRSDTSPLFVWKPGEVSNY